MIPDGAAHRRAARGNTRMRRITMLRSAAFGFAVTAGPRRTACALPASAAGVTDGTATVTVASTVSDPDGTGIGTGDVIAPGPVRGYYPSGRLVQVGGTATNTRYRADIVLPAGKAVD